MSIGVGTFSLIKRIATALETIASELKTLNESRK